jgi:hypothetical protein
MHGLEDFFWSRSQLREAELALARNEAVDGQKPLLWVDAGYAEMGNNEQVLGFRHPVGQAI